MHYLNQNPVDTSVTDASQNQHDGRSEDSYFSSCNEYFLQTDISDANSIDEDTDDQSKKTLFNLRLTSLGKRISDRLESENEEPYYTSSGNQKPGIKGGKRSRKGVQISCEDIPETKTFEFVQHKAIKFGQRASSTEIVLEEVPDLDYKDEEDNEDADSTFGSDAESLVTFPLPDDSKVRDIPSRCDPESQNATGMFTKENSEHFHNKNKINYEKQYKISQNKTDNFSLLDKPSNLLSKIHSVDSFPPRTYSREHDRDKNVFSSQTKVDLAKTAKESAYANSSDKIDNGFVSVFKNNDNDVKVCNKNLDLSNDGPSHSSPTAAQDKEKGTLVPRVEEHPLQLGSAFTEFVKAEDFGASPRNKALHAGDGPATKNEKQFEALLKAGSSKSLKSYLRNSQWPAESGVRCHLWEHLCNHLLQAEEHLYYKLVDDMHSEDADESWMLPPIIEPDSVHSYFLTACGMEHARTVVNLISYLHPDITYCPVLYPMTSLFLHYMTPEACFNCVQALLRSRRSCYFTQTKLKSEASKYVLRDLAKKYAKQAYDLMLRSGTSVEAVFDNWMWWIFRDLPFQYLVRIIDSFLLEGYKIFYRISLAIVILFAKRYSRHGNQNSATANVSSDISTFCTNISIDPRKLIQVAFGIRGLSRREISRLHERNETYLTSVPASIVSTRRLNLLRLREQVPSATLTPEMLQNIWQWIPDKLSLMKPTLIFSSNEHGTAIRTLYTRIEHASHSILAIKTTNNEIFGAFCSSPWYTRHEKNKPKTSFFGTGETFVFSMSPLMERYLWCPDHTAELFMAGDDYMLMIGSGNGTAIYLDAMLNRGSSTPSDTFNNPPLCSGSDFSCQVVEVFEFTE